MKNIHIIPTDKPSRTYKIHSIGELDWSEDYLHQVDGATNQNIYITSEKEIKEGDWITLQGILIKALKGEKFSGKEKIILTTDQDLIKDGVQAIDDDFLEWFVENPSCEEVYVEKWNNIEPNGKPSYEIPLKNLIIPKEEPKQRLEKYSERFDNDKSPIGNPETWGKRLVNSKQETLEETAENYARKQCEDMYDIEGVTGASWGWETALDFIEGAKWQQERMYSEEKVWKLVNKLNNTLNIGSDLTLEEWFEKFKKK